MALIVRVPWLGTREPLEGAPMLVGPELFPAYSDWDPVTELDSGVLAEVRDGVWEGGSKFTDDADMPRMLDDSQSEPLWHLVHGVYDLVLALGLGAITEQPQLAARNADVVVVGGHAHGQRVDVQDLGDAKGLVAGQPAIVQFPIHCLKQFFIHSIPCCQRLCPFYPIWVRSASDCCHCSTRTVGRDRHAICQYGPGGV